MLHSIGAMAFIVAMASGVILAQGVGYTDTPRLPGQAWRVHDSARPNPPVVDPGPAGEPAPAPDDAVVLFDGADLSAWERAAGGDAGWTVRDDGSMEVKAGTGDIQSRSVFGDCQLHVEWMAPAGAAGDGQGRGNSGVFFFGRYEVQILDSYDNQTYADGQAAALYGQHPPDVNACRPPGTWQTYDIIFEAPRFEGDRLVRPAAVTVMHNGVVVHHRRELLGATAHRALPSYAPHAERGPVKLQDHGDPVRFRNIWVRPLTID